MRLSVQRIEACWSRLGQPLAHMMFYMKQSILFRVLTLILLIQLGSTSAFAEYFECKMDSDCQKAGATFRCLPQKTGCPGHESDSTCVIHICRDDQTQHEQLGKLPQQAQRACIHDSDCKVVQLRCSCMYCARPDDLQKGIVDAVNKKFASEFADLSKCSAAEVKGCSMAGACANFGKSIPVCQDHVCAVVFKSNFK
jgi:hypothetical protein